jgi:acetyl esterase/lipase
MKRTNCSRFDPWRLPADREPWREITGFGWAVKSKPTTQTTEVNAMPNDTIGRNQLIGILSSYKRQATKLSSLAPQEPAMSRTIKIHRALIGSAIAVFLGTVLACAGPAGPAAPPPPALLEELDVVYGKGGDEELKLDLYAPKNLTAPAPAVILIHGGGWSGGSKKDFRDGAKGFAQQGYVAVTVEYRLAPKHKWPAQIEDVKCAVRWLRANAKKYQIDPDRIVAEGASAGGHLALMLGFTDAKDGFEGKGGNADQSSNVQLVINLFGPTDLTQPGWSDLVEKLFVDLLDGSRDKIPEAYKKASPVTYLRKGAPPVLTFHGTKDPLVPYDQAKLLDKALRDAGVVSQLETIDGKGHGDWSAEEWLRDIKVTVEFLDKNLKKK